MFEYLKVWWSNFQNRKTARAIKIMCGAMQEDPGFADVWQSNIAMTIHDRSTLTLAQSNYAADCLMEHLFDVDMVSVRQRLDQKNPPPNYDAKPNPRPVPL